MIKIVSEELYDEATQTFIPGKAYEFEYSLVAVTEWEHKYGKPFLENNNKTPEEVQDFMVMMCRDPDFTHADITPTIIEELGKYMGDFTTATKLTQPKNNGNSKTIMTSEVIYSYMAQSGLWLECENWNLNRLLTQISTIGMLMNREEMPKEEVQKTNAEINAMRRAKLNSKG
jgi:hypothetical protein